MDNDKRLTENWEKCEQYEKSVKTRSLREIGVKKGSTPYDWYLCRAVMTKNLRERLADKCALFTSPIEFWYILKLHNQHSKQKTDITPTRRKRSTFENWSCVDYLLSIAVHLTFTSIPHRNRYPLSYRSMKHLKATQTNSWTNLCNTRTCLEHFGMTML